MVTCSISSNVYSNKCDFSRLLGLKVRFLLKEELFLDLVRLNLCCQLLFSEGGKGSKLQTPIQLCCCHRGQYYYLRLQPRFGVAWKFCWSSLRVQIKKCCE